MITIETNRILLRLWRDDDAETLFKYASDPEVGPRAGWPPHKSVEDCGHWRDLLRRYAIPRRRQAHQSAEMGKRIVFRSFYYLLLIDKVHITLREWNGNAILIQSVVDKLFGSVDIADTLRHQHLLLHSDGDCTVVHVIQGNGDATL